jgi:hypothetical protein
MRVVNPDDSDDSDGEVVNVGNGKGGKKKGGKSWFESLGQDWTNKMAEQSAASGDFEPQGGKNWWDGMSKEDWTQYLAEEKEEEPTREIQKKMSQGNPYKWDEGNEPKKSLLTTELKGYGKKISRKTNRKEREGLAVSGDNSMGAIVAQRGYSQKAQKKSGAVVSAKDDIWDGKQFNELTGRSGTANPSLVLEGGSMSGGAHSLTQTNNLHAVYGGAMSKMKSEYSGKGAQQGGKNAYNAFVSKVMKEKGMKLMDAVKHIKANGLYKK